MFDVPVVLTTVETKSFSGNMWPQVQAVFPKFRSPIERTEHELVDDENFVAAIQKTGRKKIVMTGLWTETGVALPTVQAIHDGYEIYVVEDCCGDVSQLAHDNAMKRVDRGGREAGHGAFWLCSTWTTPTGRLCDTYDAVMDIRQGAFRRLRAWAWSTPTQWSTVCRRRGSPKYVVPTAAARH